MVQSGVFSDFVSSLVEAVQEDENKRMMWEFYLHKVFSGSFEDFRESLRRETADKTMPKSSIEATIKQSQKILNNFNPEKKGGGL